MDLLDAIENDVLKQKEEEAVNLFSRVADLREFISETAPPADVTVTLKMCCLSAERVNGGRGTRVTTIDADQRALFEPTQEALADLTPLKRKPYVAQITVWDAKPKKGFLGKANMEFQPGGVYTFRNVDGVGYFADIAKGNVQYERDVKDKVNKVTEELPPLKKRKVVGEAPKKNGKAKQLARKGSAGLEIVDGDVMMEAEAKDGDDRGVVKTRSKGGDNQRA